MRFFLLSLLLPVAAGAYPRSLHVEYLHDGLSAGYADWNDVNVLNHLDVSSDNQFLIETDYKSHFGGSAFFGGLNWTHSYSEDWYQDFASSFSTDSSTLPGWGFFSEIHRKVLPEKNLVFGIGAGRNQNLQPYSDVYAMLDAIYYFSRVTLQGAVRINSSHPGPVNTLRYSLATTWQVKERLELSYRFDIGREGYALIGSDNIANQFESSVHTLQASFGLTRTLGGYLNYEYYQNDFYHRNGVGIGVDILY